MNNRSTSCIIFLIYFCNLSRPFLILIIILYKWSHLWDVWHHLIFIFTIEITLGCCLILKYLLPCLKNRCHYIRLGFQIVQFKFWFRNSRWPRSFWVQKRDKQTHQQHIVELFSECELNYILCIFVFVQYLFYVLVHKKSNA